MLSNLDALLSAVVPDCPGSEIENRDNIDATTYCNTDRKINRPGCPGCPGCPGGFDSARDAKILIRALNAAGPAGLDWREGTPNDWDDVRLLAAGEVLYQDRRMVNVLGRRYLAAYAARIIEQGSDIQSPQPTPLIESSAPTSGLVDDREGGHPKGTRIAELIAAGWSPWNAKAVYISELSAAGWSLYDARIQAESEAPTAGGPYRGA